MKEKLPLIGKYSMLAEPFHCDFNHAIHMGRLGNCMLNAADFHSTERGFGMRYLNTINKTWVLSRLCVEMQEMPAQNSRFSIETWVENAKRFFTQRNFRITDEKSGSVLGYGRSIWALIDFTTRQPTDILAVRDGDITEWINPDMACPIAPPGRVKVTNEARLVASVSTKYSDIDINGHVNSVKYIEHIMDLFPLSFYKENRMRRFDIAYVAETYYGDTLNFYIDDSVQSEKVIRITKTSNESQEETEVVRCAMFF